MRWQLAGRQWHTYHPRVRLLGVALEVLAVDVPTAAAHPVKAAVGGPPRSTQIHRNKVVNCYS